ncbi:MAG: type II toxin-antitoxin system mRNA interferase toxin, RelE/StbE family [Syntrophobacteraceae bacterium CG23_combo_of_CG06-09_8_20_14_all_50_8]|nr:MAG: type II toxin-antitoxin system mRNA interferase toxin, RelE/StbE family [Syntrophobacteraceae bacterium CG23_combo_of_CG06-09_8_20_14_all_50_8]
MRTPVYTKRFEKDLKLMVKRGCDPEKIKAIIRALIEGQSLAQRYRNHLLTGNFKDRRECHIEPDWLLIYRLDGERIIFERTGAHADLFE